MKLLAIKNTAILILALIVGCATPPKPRTIVNSFDYAYSFNDVWSATIETFAEMNLPIDNMEKDSGLITSDWINFQNNPACCDCGGLGLSVEVSREGKFNVFVKNAEGGAIVKVNCRFQQTINNTLAETQTTRECVSTGSLEATIAEAISAKLQ